MVNYAESKIYKIVGSNLTYYGSTCAPKLAKRLSQHVAEYKRHKNGKCHKITSFKIFELGEYTIVLVEKFPCTCKDELRARERYCIENNDCVNKIIPNRTRAEYRQDNKKYLSLKNKEYYADNKERVKIRQSVKYLCECGGKYTQCHKLEHVETKKHQAYVARNISDSA
jgi:hypothetical protein